MYAPNANANLLSVVVLVDLGLMVQFGRDSATVVKQTGIQATSKRVGNLYGSHATTDMPHASTAMQPW